MKTIQYTITFESDWSVGEGSGQAKILDRTARRDRDGLPCVPGKSLKGILRDSAELIAQALDSESEDGEWQSFVRTLFGDNPAEDKGVKSCKGGLLDVRTARLELSERSLLVGSSGAGLRQFLFTKRPGVKLNTKGVAEDEALRMEERAIGGLTLTGTIGIPSLSQDQEEAVLALLSATFKLTERVGGKRRRGAGRCRIKSSSLPLPSKAADILEKSPPSLCLPVSYHAKYLDPAPVEEELVTKRVVLKAESPLCLTRGVHGNVVFSHTHIPGGSLLASLGVHGDQSFWDAVSSGLVHVSFAYPFDQGTGRSLPAPMSLRRHKKTGDVRARDEETDKETNYKQVRNGYASPLNPGQLTEVSKAARTHNSIEDKVQRPTEEVGGVYTYEAIEEGQEFAFEITLPKRLAPLLSKGLSLRIGRSSRQEYGEAVVSSITDAAPSQAPSVNEPILWIGSPVLLRDEKGAWNPTLENLQSALRKALGVDLTLDKEDWEIRQCVFDSFNVQASTPRPGCVGISAGSCGKVKFEATPSEERIHSLIKWGLGERRVEGFGEVLFLDRFEPHSSAPETQESSEEPLAGPQDASGIYKRLQESKLLEDIRQWSLSEDSRPIKGIEKASLSQLGGLRAAVASLRKNKAALKQWVDEGKKNKKNSESLKELLKNLGDLSEGLHTSERGAIENLFGEDTKNSVWWTDELRMKALQIVVDDAIRRESAKGREKKSEDQP